MSEKTLAEMQAELDALRAENSELKVKTNSEKPFGLKVSQKGGVSAYGLGRFPVTLYAGQWERLLEKADTIKAFISENETHLSRK